MKPGVKRYHKFIKAWGLGKVLKIDPSRGTSQALMSFPKYAHGPIWVPLDHLRKSKGKKKKGRK